MNRLSAAKREQVIRSLVEGNSINSTCRITGVAQMTVLRLLATVGAACADLHDRWFRELACERVQIDEIWSFVGMKAKNVPPDMRNTFGVGDVWTWVAIDADTKLVITWLVADRSQTSAMEFVRDLRLRLGGRVQLTSDGYPPYTLAVRGAFGFGVDYAQVVKVYNQPSKEEQRRYSPSRFTTQEISKLIGNPDEKHISTSYAERNNLNMRMMMRRMTRLTNAFSKKVENHAHQHAINFAYYNFCRIHKALRCTPAMAAGLTSTVWDISDLIYLTEEHEIMSEWDMLAFVPAHPDVLQPPPAN
jgi:IS1 family transposase